MYNELHKITQMFWNYGSTTYSVPVFAKKVQRTQNPRS